MRRAAVVLGVVLAVHVAPPARAEQDPWTRALAAEQEGDLEGALALLDANPSAVGDEKRKSHVIKLRGAVQALAAAKRQVGAGRPEVARELLVGVKGKLDPVDDVVLASALQTEIAEVTAPSERGLGSRIGTTLGSAGFTMLEWSLYFLVVGALFVALRWLYRAALRPKAGTAIVIEDLSARGGDASTMLEKQLAAAVHQLNALVSQGPSHLEAGLPESTAFMRPSALDVKLEDLVDGAAVRVGPLSVSPKYLLGVLRQLWQRPYEQTIRGWLVTEGDQQRLLMERVRHNAPSAASDRWESLAKTRAEVLADAARHLLFVLGAPTFTKSRESFVLYCRAMQAKEPEDAKPPLQAALRQDPSNWMARLELAELLSKRRNPTAAIAQIDHITKMLDKGAWKLSEHVDRELRRAAQFNRAIALSMLGSAKRKEALEIFARLLTTQRDGDDVMAIHRARDAVWLAQVIDRDEERLATVSEDIAQERIWLGERDLSKANAEQWGQHAQIQAILSTIEARALLEQQPTTPEQFETIKNALYGAMAMMPDFLEPYVTLVRLQMQGRAKHYPNWVKEAEEYLKAALELDPASEQVHYTLGKLYSLASVGEYQKAKAELSKAPNIAKSHWRLADISRDHDDDIPKALEHLRRALSLDHTVDQRLVSFVQWSLEQHARRPSPELLAEAKEKAQRLAADSKLGAKGKALLEQLEPSGLPTVA